MIKMGKKIKFGPVLPVHIDSKILDTTRQTIKPLMIDSNILEQGPKEMIIQHRFLFKIYDMIDICLLVALVMLTIKFIRWIL